MDFDQTYREQLSSALRSFEGENLDSDSGITESELDTISKLYGRDIPTKIYTYIFFFGKLRCEGWKKRSDLDGQDLICGFKAIYGRYRGKSKKTENLKQVDKEIGDAQYYFGMKSRAEDRGYFYLSEREDEVWVSEYSVYGEFIEERGEFISFLFS